MVLYHLGLPISKPWATKYDLTDCMWLVNFALYTLHMLHYVQYALLLSGRFFHLKSIFLMRSYEKYESLFLSFEL